MKNAIVFPAPKFKLASARRIYSLIQQYSLPTSRLGKRTGDAKFGEHADTYVQTNERAFVIKLSKRWRLYFKHRVDAVTPTTDVTYFIIKEEAYGKHKQSAVSS
jgi:hypothetical protein